MRGARLGVGAVAAPTVSLGIASQTTKALEVEEEPALLEAREVAAKITDRVAPDLMSSVTSTSPPYLMEVMAATMAASKAARVEAVILAGVAAVRVMETTAMSHRAAVVALAGIAGSLPRLRTKVPSLLLEMKATQTDPEMQANQTATPALSCSYSLNLMAKLISTKTIGEVREIRRTSRIDISSTVNAPVVVTAYREVLLCDDDNNIISQKADASFTRTIPGVEAETITLPDSGPTLTAAQVAQAVELFCEKWDEEHLISLLPPPLPETLPETPTGVV